MNYFVIVGKHIVYSGSRNCAARIAQYLMQSDNATYGVAMARCHGPIAEDRRVRSL